MNDPLIQQMVNELRALIIPINEKYKEVFHVNLITMIDMKEASCEKCVEGDVIKCCLRALVGYSENNPAISE